MKKFVQWSEHESSHDENASIDLVSIDATNTRNGSLKFCVEIEETHQPTFVNPDSLIGGYCACVSNAGSCQGVMPSVDRYLSNVAANMRDKKVTFIQDGHLYTPKQGLLRARTLFDTGVTDRSYISKAMVDRHREALAPHLRPYAGVVTHADGERTQKIEECEKALLDRISDAICSSQLYSEGWGASQSHVSEGNSLRGVASGNCFNASYVGE